MNDGCTPAEGSSLGEGIAPSKAINKYRASRGKVLRRLIASLADYLGRDVRVLDLGGRPDYWLNVGFRGVSRIELLNLEPTELDRALPREVPSEIFRRKVGDARRLADYADHSVDLVHSNSVIEHVGPWGDMATMAQEALRVGRAGWIQTPAWGFPMEPHFRVPFAHWFGRPMQARMMSLSMVKTFRQASLGKRRRLVDRINLLTRREVEALFPDQAIYVERMLMTKSYSVYWLPPGVPFA